MNKKVLRNRAYLMSHSFNRTKMFHSKRGWMLSSALFLATLGTLMGAGAVNKLPQQTVAPINDVVTKANNLFGNITANADKTDATSGASQNPQGAKSATSASQDNSSISSTSSKLVAPSASSKVVSGSSSASLVNNSSASKVNNKASGNQTTPVSSASANSSVAPHINSAYANYLKEMGGSNTYNSLINVEAKEANANSAKPNKVIKNIAKNNPKTTNKQSIPQATDTNWIAVSDGKGDISKYISDGQAGQWKTSQSKYYGLSWKYNKTNKAVEFTGGKLTWNGNNTPFLSQNSYIAKANSIKFDDNVDTSELSNANNMFYNDSALKSLDLGNNFNTNNVNYMRGMFASDNNLREIYLPNTFNTSKVTTMDWMFNQDHNLQSLDLHALDTHNVTSMMGMFMRDFNLKSLTLPSTFNTSKVTNMLWMFRADTGLQSLNLDPNFDTSNVTNMASMFSDEYSLPALNLGNNFDTSKVTNMEHMFDSDYILKNLNLGSKFNTNNASDMYMMFIRDGKNLSSNDGINITLSPSFNTSKAMANNLANTDQGTHNGISDMFQHANVHSLTIPQGANFKLNEQANLGDLYPKGLNTTTPHDFNQSVSNNVGTFTQLNIQASDIYGNTDGNNRPFTIDSSNQNNYRFVDRDGRITNTPIQNNGKYMVAPVYGGLTYKYNEANKSIEFVSGNTSDLTWFMNRHDMPNYIHTAQHIKFDDGINVSNATSMYNFCNVNPYIHSIDLGDNFDTHNITTMQYAFSACPNLTSITLGKKFNAPKLNNANGMFSADSKLSNLDLSMMNTTSDLKNTSWMLNTGSILKSLKFSPNFNTNSVNNMNNMFQGTTIQAVTNPSKFNSTTQLGNSWYPVASKNNQLETDSNGNYITVPNAQPVNLVDNNSHIGTWVKNPNVQKVNNTIAFTNDKTNDLVGSTTAYGALDSSYTIPKSQAPKGYSFVGNDNKITITDPSQKVSVKVAKNSNSKTDSYDKNIPVAPNPASADVEYQYKGQTIASDTTDYKGNDSRATDASDTSTNISDKNDKGLPAGWQLANTSATNVPYDNDQHTVAIEPNTNTAKVNYQYKGKTISSHTFSGNDSRATQAGNNSVNVTPTNELDIPAGYHLVNNTNRFDYNGGSDNVTILPNHVSDTVDYQLNGKTISSHKFGGNDSSAKDASDTSFDVTATNDPDIPSGYQLVSSNNQFNYNGGTHDVAIEAISQSAPVNYIYNGNVVSHGSITGNTGDKNVKPTKAPQGYHFNGTVNPYTFDPANAGNNPSDDVQVAPNTLTGTAVVHVYYNLGNGNKVDGGTHDVTLNGHYGQSDIVVNSTQYCPMNDAYQDNNADWDINVNDLTKDGNSTYNLVNGKQPNQQLNHTFTYDATEAPNLVISYDLINQSNDKLVKSNIHSDTYTPSDLGIKKQEWVDGNTITIGTKKNGDTNKLDVINAPAGYHLVDNANGYDYKNATESIQLEPNANVSGHSVVLMSTPMFFYKSNKPVTPAKPSSASNNPASATSNNNNSGSASVSPSSTNSVAPSSASQSTSTSTTSTSNSNNSSVNSDTNPVISTPTSASNASTNSGSNSDTTILPSSNTNHSIQPSSDNTSKKNSDTSDSIQTNSNVPATTNVTKDNIPTNTNVVTPNTNSSFELHGTPITINSSEPINNAVSVPSIQSNPTNNNTSSKLPQTNEVNNYVGIMALATSILSLGLAGIDLKRKYSL